MFCQNCGKKAENIGKFCEFCGGETGFELEEKKNQTQVSSDRSYRVRNTAGKPLTKKQKVLISVIAAVIVLLTIFYQIGLSITRPESIAQNYFSALSKCEYSKAFNYLSLPKSEYLTSDNYSSYMKDNFGSTPWAKTFKIDRGSENNNFKTESLSSYINISYIQEDSNDERNMTISLIKTGKKKFLFFDEWSVDPGNIVDDEWLITVPKGSKLFINGKEISTKNVKNEIPVNYFDNSEDSARSQVYSIEKIFPGEYDIKVSMENGKDFTQRMDTNGYGSNVTIIPTESFQSSIKEIINKYNAGYTKAINSKDMTPMKESISETSDTWQNISTFIGSLKMSYKKYIISLKTIEFGNIYLDDVSHARVETVEYWNANNTDNYDYSNSNTSFNSYTYFLQKIDNKWIIYKAK